jgi:ParB family chromosome partitioning protein
MDEADQVGPPTGAPPGSNREIPIELLYRNPHQPRRHFVDTDLEELAESIRQKGVLQPILARPRPGEGGEYEIIAGERRWRAAQRAGLRTVPALIREMDDREAMEMALIENIQREDLGPLEEARGFAALSERFARTQEAIAAAVGKSRSHVANSMRLLRLPQAVQDHLESGHLSAGHARTLIDHKDAEALAERIIAHGLNVRQAEALARGPDHQPRKVAARKGADSDTQALESDLSEALGLEVQIRDRDGVGELRVRYRSLEQLDDLCRRLSRPVV